MEKAGKVILVTSLWLMCACATKYESVVAPTELVVAVENSAGVPLDGANVYIYDDLSAFNQRFSTPDPVGFLSTTKSLNGIAKLGELNATSTYYLHVGFKDTAPFPGNYVNYDNSDEKFILKNKLTQGSVTYVRVVLTPADGFITFWTPSSNTAVLPIDVFYGTTKVGTVSQTFSSPPGISAPGATTIRTRKGVVTWEGKSASGCIWSNTITLAGAQSVFYQLEDCGVGTIAFYTDNTNASRLPITLKLNANDVLTNIISVVSAVPPDCNAANLVKAIRVPGTYTYLATSTVSGCAWTGSFVLAANQCKLIPLSICP